TVRRVSSFVLLEYPAFLHHEAHLLELADVADWIAANGNDISGFAGADRSENLRVADEIGSIDGRRLNRLHGRHAILDHEGELTRIDPVRADARVRAEGDFHARANRLGEIFAL